MTRRTQRNGDSLGGYSARTGLGDKAASAAFRRKMYRWRRGLAGGAAPVGRAPARSSRPSGPTTYLRPADNMNPRFC